MCCSCRLAVNTSRVVALKCEMSSREKISFLERTRGKFLGKGKKKKLRVKCIMAPVCPHTL